MHYADEPHSPQQSTAAHNKLMLIQFQRHPSLGAAMSARDVVVMKHCTSVTVEIQSDVDFTLVFVRGMRPVLRRSSSSAIVAEFVASSAR